MIREAISHVTIGATLSENEAAVVMEEIMTGVATQAQMGAFLTALHLRPGNETVQEITGLARVMRQKAVRVHLNENIATQAIDTCGTGGDRAGTFNVSTAAGIVAAAAATIPAAVETLNVPALSPPVPHVSIACIAIFSFKCTRTAFCLITRARPVISCTVSLPGRRCNAVRKAPICAWVATPVMISSITMAASFSLNVAPVVTCEIASRIISSSFRLNTMLKNYVANLFR